jgi:hypothetical protein
VEDNKVGIRPGYTRRRMSNAPRMTNDRWAEIEKLKAGRISTATWTEIKAEVIRARTAETSYAQEAIWLRNRVDELFRTEKETKRLASLLIEVIEKGSQ